MLFVQVLTNSQLKYITADLILNLNVKWGCSASGDDNNVRPLTNIYYSWFSCALDFDKTENLSPRVDLEIFAGCRIRASINEDLKISLQSRALQGCNRASIN
ncbi:hypothetical protein V1477_012804 [Vespula maculifrons]|uniref:Uncharacterized protein n=1 Tax=Vespula maculifrons TaxID=7453 RepID=A0ABD2BU38_VESMC